MVEGTAKCSFEKGLVLSSLLMWYVMSRSKEVNHGLGSAALLYGREHTYRTLGTRCVTPFGFHTEGSTD